MVLFSFGLSIRLFLVVSLILEVLSVCALFGLLAFRLVDAEVAGVGFEDL